MKRIIALLLTGLMLFTCVGCITITGLSCSVPVRYANADKYTAGNFTYESDKVEKVEIEWASGGIKLLNGKGTLSVTESGSDELSEDEQMHWWLDGKTLKIKFCKSGYNLPITKTNKKELTVELPDFVDLEIDVASGKVSAENMLNLGKLKLETASGGTDIKFLSAKEVKVDSASGGIAFGSVSVTGDFNVNTASGGLTVDRISANEIDVDSASGGVTLGIDTVEKIKIDSASGAIKLKLNEPERGATLRCEKVSGSVNVKLPYEKDGETYKIGLGATEIKIEVVSGGITIE
ncbi:MAG: DUF4097 family beta strand repeat protein [Clostridia bacterium]|nr:DUF4097 family beta strand repeat protein [Clostridia bacterium]